MKSLYKLAQKYNEDLKTKKDSATKMLTYVGMLRGLAILHQHAHWISKSSNYYGDHLLFDRLYTEVTQHIDDTAEKTIGLFDPQTFTVSSHMDIAKSFVDDVCKNCSEDDLAKRSLIAEETFLDYSKSVYNALKESDDMTLGLDDMIMSIASKHETLVYLLKQRMK